MWFVVDVMDWVVDRLDWMVKRASDWADDPLFEDDRAS